MIHFGFHLFWVFVGDLLLFLLFYFYESVGQVSWVVASGYFSCNYQLILMSFYTLNILKKKPKTNPILLLKIKIVLLNHQNINLKTQTLLIHFCFIALTSVRHYPSIKHSIITISCYSVLTRCAKYKNVAPSCVMVPDPTDPVCCQAPQCSSPTGKTPVGVTGSVTGIGKPPTPTPYVAPTPRPGQTYPPFLIPTPGSTAKPKPGRCLPGQCQVFAWSVAGVYLLSGRCLPGQCQVFTWSVAGVCLVSGRCLPGQWQVFTWSVAGVYLVSGRCLPGQWQVFT